MNVNINNVYKNVKNSIAIIKKCSDSEGKIDIGNNREAITLSFLVLVRVHCRDFNFVSSHGLFPSDLVAQSVEQWCSNPKVVRSIPTLVRVFLCPCVGPLPSVGLTLTWFT